jgi:hypothetical protein
MGMAIAVIIECKNKNLPSTKVELDVVLCLTQEYFIYVIVTDQVAQEPESNEYLPGYLLLKLESTDSLFRKFMHGTQWTLPDSNQELRSYTKYKKVCVPKSDCWTFHSVAAI